jgi:hypothetical protein
MTPFPNNILRMAGSFKILNFIVLLAFAPDFDT